MQWFFKLKEEEERRDSSMILFLVCMSIKKLKKNKIKIKN